MEASISPLSISISSPDGRKYKSISRMTWEDIPGFAILTGRNGSGKTQLLEIIAYHFSKTYPPSPPPHGLPVNVQVDGYEYTPDEIGYLPSIGRFSGGTTASIANMLQIKDQALNLARSPHQYQNDIVNKSRAIRIQKIIGNINIQGIPTEKARDFLDDDYDFAIDDVDVTTGITHVFMAFRYKMLESLERETPGIDKNGKPIGPPPWTIVNEALQTAGFPYEVIPPTNIAITAHYDLRLRDLHSGAEIAANDLSSGEKVLLQLILWLFTANRGSSFPKLLILDEPDAHLHPSMTRQFLDVVSDVLVDKHGIRVILTTHSPSTVALAHEHSIFQIDRGSQTVRRVESKASVISSLTSGLITVSKTTKFCFVEDEDDVEFYKALYEIISDDASLAHLRPMPSVVFIPASLGSGSDKIPGGKSVVQKWVEKLDSEPLTSMFFGIIDGDGKHFSHDRIFQLSRYSFENYLLDPVNLYGLLLQNNSAPNVEKLSITSGNEHLLRVETSDNLQRIIDKICSIIESSNRKLKHSGKFFCQYTSGQCVEIPQWVAELKEHDLLAIAQASFGGPKLITPPRLLQSMRRVRLTPADLAKVLSSIQSA